MVSRLLRVAFLAGTAATASVPTTAAADGFSFNFETGCISANIGGDRARVCPDGRVRGRVGPLGLETTGKRNVFFDNQVFSCPANARHINNIYVDCGNVTANFAGVSFFAVPYGRDVYMCPEGTVTEGIGERGLKQRCAILAHEKN